MDPTDKLIAWTQNKASLYIGIMVVIAANLGSVAMLLFFWNDLEFYRIGLFVSILASLVFLWFYAIKLEKNRGKVNLKFLFGQKQFGLEDISDARIYKRRGSEYLRIKFTKGYGPRKVFQFFVHQNGPEIAHFLNLMMKQGVKVYANRTLETKVQFNKELRRFECEE